VLAYQFVATRDVELKGLRFPFSLRWHCGRGIHQLSKSHGGELFRQMGKVHIRREEMFDVYMAPDRTGAVTGRLEIDLVLPSSQSEPDWEALARTYSTHPRGFGLSLAQTMFQLPWYPWQIEAVASRMDTKPRSLQMVLFRESYSFDAALRRCRQLNTLLRAGRTDCIFELVPEAVGSITPKEDALKAAGKYPGSRPEAY